MTALTFAFTGPDGQHVSAVRGVVVVNVDDLGLRWDLEDAAWEVRPVSPPGPWWIGRKGIGDADSAYWAARSVVPGWTFVGEAPSIPWIPAPDSGVLH